MAQLHSVDEDPLTAEEVEVSIGGEATNMAKDANNHMRETIVALHRASMHSHEDIRQASLSSLVEIVRQQYPNESANLTLVVLQTWLEQFARTNGGSSPKEYCAPDRVRLLQSLMTITDNMTSMTDSNAFRAAVSRTVTLATEEMTRQFEITDQVQLPCSKILVRLGSRNSNVQRVMDALIQKFQPGSTSHFYVITTLYELATCNSTQVVPFLKAILSTMMANIKSVKKDSLRYAYASAFSRFSEAILDYLANIDDAPDPSITRQHFSKEIDAAHEILFASWLHGKGMSLSGAFDVNKVKNAVIEAVGCMGPLLSDERLYKQTASPVCSSLLGLYKKVPEGFYITQCVCNLLKAMIERDLQIIDAIIEPLFTALFVQVCQYAAISSDNVDNFKRKNHYEVLRCYDLLIRSHPDKLVSGLLLRLNSVDENIRVSALIVFRHLLNSSLEVLQPRMGDVFSALHSRLQETSNRVRKMLAQLTALLGSLGYLEGGQKGQDFLEFIVTLCALPTSDQSRNGASGDLLQYLTSSDGSNYAVVSNANLREMCDSILQLLTKEAMEDVLWPFLLDFLLAPEYANAVPALVKSLSQLALKKRRDQTGGGGGMIEYANFKHVHGPYALLARLLVLAAVPVAEESINVLTFMQNFAPNMNKHLSTLWDQRIPLLQHYLQQTKAIDQDQWEEWLLALMDDTLSEIDLEEWNNAFVAAMTQQLEAFYSGKNPGRGKVFLMKAAGRALIQVKQKTLVLDTLGHVFSSTRHSDPEQQAACSMAFGFASKKHLGLAIEKLESLLKAEFNRKRGMGPSSFFGFMRDTKLEDEQLATRCTILCCVGSSATQSQSSELKTKADEICQKFIMPAMQSAHSALKLAALKAISDLAKALRKINGFSLIHHQDLIHESIECMKAKPWLLSEKQTALVTTLELAQLPPHVSQLTRCSILKACFTAVFPSLVRLQQSGSYTCWHQQEDSSPLSSGQSTPTRSFSHPPVMVSTGPQELKGILDKLLSLVQVLLLQELRQSTLDEIFTLLEPYLKLTEVASREMSMSLLFATLKTFRESAERPEDEGSFSPGPYIIGSLVPRCFDSSRHVQSTALACLRLLVQIGHQYEQGNSLSEESEEALVALERISASCSPMTMTSSMVLDLLDPSGISPVLISKTVSNVLRLEMGNGELLPLLHSVIDGLADEVVNSAKGASLVLCSLLETRGRESKDVAKHCSLLVSKLHGKLIALERNVEVQDRTVLALRVLATHNVAAVIGTLLADYRLPFDSCMVKVWKVMSQEKVLAEFLLKFLLQKVNLQELLIYETDKITCRKSTIVNHVPLAAMSAMSLCLETKEFEAVVENEFADIVVPLLLAMASYCGLTCSTASSKADDLVDPLQVSLQCLKAFLSSKGCHSLSAGMTGRLKDPSLSELVNFVSYMAESLCVDFPLYLPGMTSALGQVKDSEMQHTLMSASFYAQLMTTEAVIDAGLLHTATMNLLNVLKLHDDAQLRAICLQGLAGFKIDTPAKHERLNKHAEEIIAAVLDATGDDLQSVEVNQAALTTLASLLRVMPQTTIIDRTTQIINKIAPFFDGYKHRRDAAAAMKVLGCLTQLCKEMPPSEAADVNRELLRELVHSLIVSLILHCNDIEEETRDASRLVMADIFAFYQVDANDLFTVKKTSSYSENLKEFARIPQFKDFFMPYLEKALTYFSSGDARLRCSAVLFVTCLLVDGLEVSDHANTEKISSAMGKLLNDPNIEVKIAAATNIGRVCIALSGSEHQRRNL